MDVGSEGRVQKSDKNVDFFYGQPHIRFWIIAFCFKKKVRLTNTLTINPVNTIIFLMWCCFRVKTTKAGRFSHFFNFYKFSECAICVQAKYMQKMYEMQNGQFLHSILQIRQICKIEKVWKTFRFCSFFCKHLMYTRIINNHIKNVLVSTGKIFIISEGVCTKKVQIA